MYSINSDTTHPFFLFRCTCKIAATKIATGKFGHSEKTARDHYFSTLRNSDGRYIKHYHSLFGEISDSPVQRYKNYPKVAQVDVCVDAAENSVWCKGELDRQRPRSSGDGQPTQQKF